MANSYPRIIVEVKRGHERQAAVFIPYIYQANGYSRNAYNKAG